MKCALTKKQNPFFNLILGIDLVVMFVVVFIFYAVAAVSDGGQ